MSQFDESHDVLIIGGGPAGLAAAVWCSDLGLRALVLEREKITGGQLNWTFNRIANFLGFEDIEPEELRERLERQAKAFNVDIERSANLKQIDLAAGRLELEDGRVFTGRAIVIATGVRRRMLGVPGELEFTGRGVLVSGVKDLVETKGRNVVVIGGGDAAAENAIKLSEYARSVTLVHRRDGFTARSAFMETISSLRNVNVLTSCELCSIDGIEHVQSVTIKDRGAGLRRLKAEHVLIRVGVIPNSELFATQVELNNAGYIQVGVNGLTSVDLVYAAGDVACPVSPTLNSAIGMGVTAAKDLRQRLK